MKKKQKKEELEKKEAQVKGKSLNLVNKQEIIEEDGGIFDDVEVIYFVINFSFFQKFTF